MRRVLTQIKRLRATVSRADKPMPPAPRLSGVKVCADATG